MAKKSGVMLAKDIPEWSNELSIRKKLKALKDKTFEELSDEEKDALLKSAAINLGLIQKS